MSSDESSWDTESSCNSYEDSESSDWHETSFESMMTVSSDADLYENLESFSDDGLDSDGDGYETDYELK